MFLKREIPKVIRILMFSILAFSALIYLAFLTFIERLIGRVRR